MKEYTTLTEMENNNCTDLELLLAPFVEGTNLAIDSRPVFVKYQRQIHHRIFSNSQSSFDFEIKILLIRSQCVLPSEY